MLRRLLALVVVLLAAVPARADVSDREAQLRQGVLLVVSQVPGGAGLGSAFAVARTGTTTWLVTNHHVVAEGGMVGVWLQGSDQLTPVTVVAQQEDADLALLRAEGLDAPPLSLATRGGVHVGRDVGIIGYPRVDAFVTEGLGVTASIHRGIISAVRTRGQVPLIQTDASINPGNSGGPALDWESCRVVGVATSKMREAEGISLLVSVDAVHDLLQANGIRASAGSRAEPQPRSLQRKAPAPTKPPRAPAEGLARPGGPTAPGGGAPGTRRDRPGGRPHRAGRAGRRPSGAVSAHGGQNWMEYTRFPGA